MNPKHLIFIKGMLKHGNAIEAYRKAYPDAAPESCRTAAARLLSDSEVKQMIDKANAAARAELEVELKEMAKERQLTEIMDVHEKRKVLAQMVRGEIKMKRHVKLNNAMIEVADDLSPFAVLRAIELDTKLAENWYAESARTPKTIKPAEQEEENGRTGYLCIRNEACTDLTEHELMERAWEEANPDKIRKGKGTKLREDLISLSVMYLVRPPWADDPTWYERQPKPVLLRGQKP